MSSMSSNFQFTSKKVSNPEKTFVVDLVGDLDESNQKELTDLMKRFLLDDNIENIVFNIRGLDYMNSGVIGALATAHSDFISAKKQFVFSEANENIFDIMDLVGLTSVIECFASNEEACLSFED